ncbi:hypothetical protein MN116_000223, partial [Schistosoma mekongi]
AAITFHLRPMNCTLYWFMLLMLYLNLLFVDNRLAQEANYTDSESLGLLDYGFSEDQTTANVKRFLLEDIGFTFKVHQKTFKSLIAFRSEATVFMADAFENGKPVRSFRIVDGYSSQTYVYSRTHSNSIIVYCGLITYCKSHPATYVNLRMFIYKSGTIQYEIFRVDGETDDCPMTIEIRDGIYNVSADGSETIIHEEVIHKKVCPSSSIVKGRVFTFFPQPRCRAQTSEETCAAESQLDANCSWCRECKTCLRENNTQSSLSSTSICNCAEKVKTTVSEVNGLNDNGSSTDYESSKATSQRHDIANGMSTIVHGVTESTKNTNDNNNSTIDYESSKATTQRQDVQQTKSTNDSKPLATYTKPIYCILGIVLVLFILFIVCLILWKYLYKQY